MSNNVDPMIMAAIIFGCTGIILYVWFRVIDIIFVCLKHRLWKRMSNEEKQAYWDLGGDFMKDQR